jgi:hypothetical protein
MGKKNINFPSESALQNDRSTHLGNAQSYLHEVRQINYRLTGPNTKLSDQDIFRLLELSDDCARTLKKYLSPRSNNAMEKDALLNKIDKEISQTNINTDFQREIDWLRSFGECFATSCEDFVGSNPPIRVQSMQELYKQSIRFRSQFGELYSKKKVKFQVIRDNFDNYRKSVFQVICGTALVCDDGIKYYKPRKEAFSTDSIWLGSRIFLFGGDKILELGNAEEKLLS